MIILFVCSANVCRSALAEAILNKKLRLLGIEDVVVESAGVLNLAGQPRDAKMVEMARNAGYEMCGAAKYVEQTKIDTADLIVCMDFYHLVEIQKRLDFKYWKRIHRFMDICFGDKSDLPDPSGDTDYMYQYVFHKIEEGCDILAQKILLKMEDEKL